MGRSRPAIVLERTKDRISIDLVAWSSQEAAAVITANVITVRSNGAIVDDVPTGARFQDGICKLDRAASVDAGAVLGGSIVAADRAIGDVAPAVDSSAIVVGHVATDRTVGHGDCALDATTTQIGIVAADRAVSYVRRANAKDPGTLVGSIAANRTIG